MNADQLWAKLEEVRAARFKVQCTMPKNVFHAKILKARKADLCNQERALQKEWQLAKYGRTGF